MFFQTSKFQDHKPLAWDEPPSHPGVRDTKSYPVQQPRTSRNLGWVPTKHKARSTR